MKFFTVKQCTAIGAGIGGAIGFGACALEIGPPIAFFSMLVTTERQTSPSLPMMIGMTGVFICALASAVTGFQGAKLGAAIGARLERCRSQRDDDVQEDNRAALLPY